MGRGPEGRSGPARDRLGERRDRSVRAAGWCCAALTSSGASSSVSYSSTGSSSSVSSAEASASMKSSSGAVCSEPSGSAFAASITAGSAMVAVWLAIERKMRGEVDQGGSGPRLRRRKCQVGRLGGLARDCKRRGQLCSQHKARIRKAGGRLLDPGRGLTLVGLLVAVFITAPASSSHAGGSRGTCGRASGTPRAADGPPPTGRRFWARGAQRPYVCVVPVGV